MSNWLDDLFIKQEKLDDFVVEKNNIKINYIYDCKFNAFMVELGEFLNEVKAFKYWSVKEIDIDKAYEEFVDGIHFILSIGNSHFRNKNTNSILRRVRSFKVELYDFNDDEKKKTFVSRSNSLYTSSKMLKGTYEEYEDYFINYLILGLMIGLTEERIVDEYNKKHEINYIRQKNGY